MNFSLRPSTQTQLTQLWLMGYLEDLPRNSGNTLGYDEVFEATKQNIKTVWGTLALALGSNDPNLFNLPKANRIGRDHQAARF
jgi:hypothetical protein